MTGSGMRILTRKLGVGKGGNCLSCSRFVLEMANMIPASRPNTLLVPVSDPLIVLYIWVQLGLCAKLLHLYPTLCNPLNCSLPRSSFHGINKQEHWSGLPCPLPGDLPDPGIKPVSPAFQPASLLLMSPGKPPSLG